MARGGDGFNGNKIPPPPGPGRPKGSVNKIGAQAKENVVIVFSRLGGTDAMLRWAKRNRTEFYRMYARLIPNYVMAHVDIRDVTELSDVELINVITGSSRDGTAGAQEGEAIPGSIH
jgi:hypothetical protein